MDIITDIEGAFARVEAHIKTLIDGGAPHQQAHAKDLQALVATAKGAPVGTAIAPDVQTEIDNLEAQVATLNTELATANAKITTLQGNADNLLMVRDNLQAQLGKATADLKTAQDALTTQETADNAKIADLEAQLVAAKSPLSAAAGATGGRVASGASVQAGTNTDPITGAVVQPLAQP